MAAIETSISNPDHGKCTPRVPAAIYNTMLGLSEPAITSEGASAPKSMSTTVITEITDDLLLTPDKGVLIHATNCVGEWGAGVALAIKKSFPAAFEVYKTHCASVNKAEDLAGTCLLISPQEADSKYKKRWIACLFTSIGYGDRQKRNGIPPRSKPDEIRKYTRSALEALRKQVEAFDTTETPDADKPGALWSAKFNQGNFRVPWDTGEMSTSAILREVFAGHKRTVMVVDNTSIANAARKRRRSCGGAEDRGKQTKITRQSG